MSFLAVEHKLAIVFPVNAFVTLGGLLLDGISVSKGTGLSVLHHKFVTTPLFGALLVSSLIIPWWLVRRGRELKKTQALGGHLNEEVGHPWV